MNSKPVRVLHCTSSLKIGGVATLMLRNLSAMDQDRFENYVCYLVPRSHLTEEYTGAGFTPICLDHRSAVHGPRTLRRLVRLIKAKQIDLVHTNLWLDRFYGGLAAAICGVPVVTSLHATNVDVQPMRNRREAQFWFRSLVVGSIERMQTKRYIAVSDAVREMNIRIRRLPKERIKVLYSGLSLEDFQISQFITNEQEELRQTLELGDSYPLLVNVGRLVDAKGQKYLLPMMQRIRERWPKAKLLVAGEGEERTHLECEIERLNLQDSVLLLGQRNDVPNLLQLADIFVFPSLNEGFGLALTEAMAAGKPIIASSLPVLAEVIEDGSTGYLVEPGNPEALAQAVMQVLELPNGGAEIGEAAKQVVKQRFNIQSSIKEMENLYLDIIHKTRD